jgi:hypothetical protein
MVVDNFLIKFEQKKSFAYLGEWDHTVHVLEMVIFEQVD